MTGLENASMFDDALDQELSLGGPNRAFFGRDVLAGLVDGIRAAQLEPVSRFYRLGPVVLGCAMFMDDLELLTVLGQIRDVCVVITKQQQSKYSKPAWERLKALSSARGLPAWAFPELEGLAAPRDGRPRVIGPYGPDLREEMQIGAVREMGFRKVNNRLVPIVHAKLMLLGHLWWTDEHPSGYTVETFGFDPDRLWIGSANFTSASRRSLEFGMWTNDPTLLQGAQQFLLGLIARSEPLQSAADDLQPEYQPVEYDDQAFWEAVADEIDGPYGSDIDDY